MPRVRRLPVPIVPPPVAVVDPTHYLLEVARGNITGLTALHKFGYNPDLDSGAGFEALWNGGGNYTGFDAVAAETVEVFSSDATDNQAGVGARSIFLDGLDSNYASQTETLLMHATDGTIGVTSVNSYIRQPRAYVVTAGTTGTNVGQITCRQSVTTANVFVQMPALYGQSMVAAYTIPAGKTAYLFTWGVSAVNNTSARFTAHLKIRLFGGASRVQEQIALDTAATSSTYRVYEVPKNSYTGKSDIWVEADTNTNNTSLAGSFNIILADDPV